VRVVADPSLATRAARAMLMNAGFAAWVTSVA
jgi:hypothetical protein